MPSDVVMTVRVMPEGLEVDLETLKDGIIKALEGVASQVRIVKQPIAFDYKIIYKKLRC